MMRYCSIVLMAFLLAALTSSSRAQQAKIDSLLAVANGASSPENEKAKALNALGNTAMAKGDFFQAIEYYTRSSKHSGKSKNASLMAQSLALIGEAYSQQGDQKRAIAYFTRSLALLESLADSAAMGATLANIGLMHRDQGAFSQAITFYNSALNIQEKLGNRQAMAAILTNLGGLYRTKKDGNQAIAHFNRALALQEQTNDRSGMANSLVNLGINFQDDQKNREKALEYYTRGLSLYEEIGDAKGMAATLNSIGLMHNSKGDLTQAIDYSTRALEAARKANLTLETLNAASALWGFYKADGQNDKALQMHELYIELRDEMTSAANEREVIRQQLQYDFGKKELDMQKEAQLNALRYEYDRKQMAARNQQERQQLLYEEELKRTSIEFDFAQKQAAAETEQVRKEAQARAVQAKKDALAAEDLRKKVRQRNTLFLGFAGVLLLAIVFFTQRNRIAKEKLRSEELLLNILPFETAKELKATGQSEAKLISEATVIFTDFKGFTQLSEQLTPQQLVKDLNECFSAFDSICHKHGVEKIKTIGDAYMAAGGLPTPNDTHALDVVKAAFEMRDFIAEGKARKIAQGLPFFEVRIGIHTGPVVAGIVGIKKFQYDIWGDTVNTASRMESSSEAGRINVSETTYQLIKDHYICTYRGELEAKGKGKVKMYFVG
jgi:adenylate cyclase